MIKCFKYIALGLAVLIFSLSFCGCDTFFEDILKEVAEALPEDEAVTAAEAVPKIAFGNEPLSKNSNEVILTVEELKAEKLITAELRSDHHYNQLTENEQTVYFAYLYAIEKGYKYVYVDKLIEEETEDLEKTFLYLSLDSPFLEQNFNYEAGTFTTSYDIGEGKRASLEGVYLCALNFTAEHWNKKTEALAKAKDLVQKMPENLSEAEQAEYLYEYTLRNVEYLDYDNADVSTQHFLYDGLIKGKTHCDGTANMYSLLLNLAGIENFERSYDGTEEQNGHTWNTVKIGDKWYNVDATALREKDDFELRIKRNFAVEDKLLGYPSTVKAEYPVCDQNLKLDLLSYDSASESRFAGDVKKQIRQEGYAVIYIKDYNESAMEKTAQKLANSLDRTVSWYESKAQNDAMVVMFK